MKNNKIDRLFQDKLNKHQVEPSNQAWQQLEKQLNQKKDRKGWVFFSSIAASLLLLFGLWAAIEYSATVLPVNSVGMDEKPPVEKFIESSEPSVSRHAQTPEQPDAPVAGHEQENSKVMADKNSKPSGLKKAVKKPEKLPVQEKEVPQKPATALAESQPKEAEQQHVILKSAEAKSFKGTLPDPEKPTAPSHIAAEASESIVILYKADEPEQEQYLKESNKIAELATADDDEKENPARKVLGFLKKVKRNSTGNLAELREAKDELLSFRIGREN